MRFSAAMLATAAAISFTTTSASADGITSDATVSAPALIPTSHFVDQGYIRYPIISPDGQNLVFRERIGNKTFVGIKPVDSDEIKRVGFPETQRLNWYRWTGNGHILISISSVLKIGDFEFRSSDLAIFDLTAGTTRRLGGNGGSLDGDDIIYQDPNGEFLLMAIQKSIYDYPGVFRINIADGSRTEIVKPQSNIWTWMADDQGVVRMGFAYSPYSTKIFYRRTNDEPFRLISKIREKDSDDEKAESLIDVSRIVSGKDEGYVLSNKDTGRFALYKFNYLTREVGELVFGHPENDVTSFALSDDGSALESVRYTDSRDRILWFDADLKKRQTMLDKTMPDREVWMQSRSRDGKRMVVYTTSPTDPGSYALFEPGARKLHRFAAINDMLEDVQLAETQYLRYEARDGLSIPAYLTLPVGREAKNLPLIILPHGGPFGVRDTLDYNMEVQFLANRGYAVLQPNFRGSESYGEEFYKRGEGQIGRGMQDDLDDGMDWLAKQGVINPSRVCIVGSSYGGYAALWGVIRNPERYRCAASFAGVTDFKSQLKYDGKSLRSRYARAWRDKIRGEEDFDLDSVSPSKNIARLDRPILLAHGDVDSNVPYSQFKKMVDAAKKARKPIESHTYKGEGHGFDDSANQKDWLDRLEAFLALHNPSDVNRAGTVATPPAPAPMAQ